MGKPSCNKLKGACVAMRNWKRDFSREDAAARFPLAVSRLGADFSAGGDLEGAWESLAEDECIGIVDSAGFEQRVFGVSKGSYPNVECLGRWEDVMERILPDGLPVEHSETERDDGLSAQRAWLACGLSAAARTRAAPAGPRADELAAALAAAVDANAETMRGDPFFSAEDLAGAWASLSAVLVADLCETDDRASAALVGPGRWQASSCAAWALLACHAQRAERAAAKASAGTRAGGGPACGDVWEHLKLLKKDRPARPGGASP